METFIRNVIKNAAIYSTDLLNNANFISSKLQEAYGGFWTVVIITEDATNWAFARQSVDDRWIR